MTLLIIIILFIVAAETTYLTVRNNTSPYQRKGAERPVFVDTSVLIDGRIIAVAESGFITSRLIIPRSVVGELQLLADQGDHDKRTRARHGLDVVSQLQAINQVRVEIMNDGTSAKEGVDNRLLSLAKKYNGAICTIDFNLNKVAQVEHINVLNVNDLAMKLRMTYLPGEKMILELTQKGNDSHQAIGHLQDGTMVVVEQASAKVGQSVEIEFIRSLQTAAGKMMFARLTSQKNVQKSSVQEESPLVSPKNLRPAKKLKGRQPASDKPSKKMEESKKQVRRPHQTKQRSQYRPNQKDKEDSLIALVNEQHD